jgi:ankyrin repeat protein
MCRIDFNSSPTELAWTRILSLTSSDKVEKVPRLRRMFDVEEVFDNMGFTYLHIIVAGLKQETLESVLEENTSNREKIDNQGKTPLMWAAARGDCEKVRKLLEYDASTTSRDYEGRCALS